MHDESSFFLLLLQYPRGFTADIKKTCFFRVMDLLNFHYYSYSLCFLLILLDFHLMAILLALTILKTLLIVCFMGKSFPSEFIQSLIPILHFVFHRKIQRNPLILRYNHHHRTPNPHLFIYPL